MKPIVETLLKRSPLADRDFEVNALGAAKRCPTDFVSSSCATLAAEISKNKKIEHDDSMASAFEVHLLRDPTAVHRRMAKWMSSLRRNFENTHKREEATLEFRLLPNKFMGDFNIQSGA